MSSIRSMHGADMWFNNSTNVPMSIEQVHELLLQNVV